MKELCIPDAPHMDNNEIALFRKYIPSGGRALEFGCGGSTRFFFGNGIEKLFSVENDIKWAQCVLNDNFLRPFVQAERLKLFMIDIGPLKENAWGIPDGMPTHLWLKYHSEVWSCIESGKLDFILIDGRFRVACALKTILYCKQRPLVFIHDFWNRAQYFPILSFMNVIDRIDTSVVLQQKWRIDWRAFCMMLQHYQLNFE